MAERYSRIEDGGEIVETRRFDIAPDPNPKKGLDWRPHPEAERPKYDGATHHPPVKSIDIQDDQVVESWADPVAKTRDELDAEKDERQAAEVERTTRSDSIDKAIATVLFEVINDVRLLKTPPQAPITAPQFRAYLKSKM